MKPTTRPTHNRHAEFESIALQHLPALRRLALRLTQNPSDADDVVQETYLRAYVFFDKFAAGTNSRAWLMKLLYNTFINIYRRRASERKYVNRYDPESVYRQSGPEGVPDGIDPQSDRIGKYYSDEVKQAVHALPEEFRSAVLLADVHDLSYQEIADSMQCPSGTVMSRIFRGRKLLQKQLQGYAERNRIVMQQAA